MWSCPSRYRLIPIHEQNESHQCGDDSLICRMIELSLPFLAVTFDLEQSCCPGLPQSTPVSTISSSMEYSAETPQLKPLGLAAAFWFATQCLETHSILCPVCPCGCEQTPAIWTFSFDWILCVCNVFVTRSAEHRAVEPHYYRSEPRQLEL